MCLGEEVWHPLQPRSAKLRLDTLCVASLTTSGIQTYSVISGPPALGKLPNCKKIKVNGQSWPNGQGMPPASATDAIACGLGAGNTKRGRGGLVSDNPTVNPN